MLKLGGMIAVGAGAVTALSLLLAPATAATTQQQKVKKVRSSLSFASSSFTPAVADPKLAAEFARRGFQANSFRFTPSSAARGKTKAVTVAVRARTNTAAPVTRVAAAETSASQITAITPTAYNLGVAVGWKRFALSGDVAKVQGGPVPGGRETAELGVSYLGNNFTGRVALGADRTDGTQPRILPDERSYSLDVGGSYALARNLEVTGGVRYKIQRDRLEALADERRDSQAVYVGTAFRF